MLSVAGYAIIMENPKMAKIIYRQMLTPRELTQQIPALPGKAMMQKLQGAGKFLVQIPGGGGGASLWMKLIPALLLDTWASLIYRSKTAGHFQLSIYPCVF